MYSIKNEIKGMSLLQSTVFYKKKLPEDSKNGK